MASGRAAPLDRVLRPVHRWIWSDFDRRVRKLSELAGISNPYLSQIERGLRKPSAEILQAIARALRISAEI